MLGRAAAPLALDGPGPGNSGARADAPRGAAGGRGRRRGGRAVRAGRLRPEFAVRIGTWESARGYHRHAADRGAARVLRDLPRSAAEGAALHGTAVRARLPRELPRQLATTAGVVSELPSTDRHRHLRGGQGALRDRIAVQAVSARGRGRPAPGRPPDRQHGQPHAQRRG